MEDKSNNSDVSSFLAKAKKLLSKGNYVFVPREKNMQALSEHGLTIKDAKNEMLELSADDYYKGPKKDFDPSQTGDIWEFKKDIDGELFYVKMKIQAVGGKDILKCLSFHKAEYQ